MLIFREGYTSANKPMVTCKYAIIKKRCHDVISGHRPVSSVEDLVNIYKRYGCTV